MFVKINTKAHFSILNATTAVLHANMAEELKDVILRTRADPPYNIILVLEEVTEIDDLIIQELRKVQETGGRKKSSFVITEILPSLMEKIKNAGLNVVPTLAEAIDLVMMEQLEREL